MITKQVTQNLVELAQQQVAAFEKETFGQYRYPGVEAWKGIVCELLVQEWLESEGYSFEQKAKGLDTSGKVDKCDIAINGVKIEVKSATQYFYKSIMPKIHDFDDNSQKDILIGAKYNETTRPESIDILGFITVQDAIQFPIEQDKGAPYYNIPLNQLTPIGRLRNYLNNDL